MAGKPKPQHYQVVAMPKVIEHYKRVCPRGMWFAPVNPTYFDETRPRQAYLNEALMQCYFVTGEQYVNHASGQVGTRRYSVRCMNWLTGEMSTVPPFNGYSRAEANKMARHLANKVDVEEAA